MIDYTDMTVTGSLPREKFIETQAVRCGVTVEHLLRFHEIVECKCGEQDCPGWRAVWKSAAQRS